MTGNIHDPILLRDKLRILGGKAKGVLKYGGAAAAAVTAYALAQEVNDELSAHQPTGEKMLAFGEDGRLHEVSEGSTAFDNHVLIPLQTQLDSYKISILAPDLYAKMTDEGKKQIKADDWILGYQIDVDTLDMKLTASEKGSDTNLESKEIPFDQYRGEGKLAEILGVKDTRLIPSSLIEGKPFTMSIDNKNVTEGLYTVIGGEERPIIYTETSIALGYDFTTDGKLLGKASFSSPDGKNIKNYTLDENLTAAFFDELENHEKNIAKNDGKIDELEEILKDFKDSVNSKRLYSNLEQLYQNAENSITGLQNLLSTINGTHAAEIINLTNSYQENITNIYNYMDQLNLSLDEKTLAAVRENVTRLNDQFNQTYADLDGLLTTTTVANKNTFGNIYYNWNASQQGTFRTAVNRTSGQIDLLNDDNTTLLSPELLGMTVTKPGLSNTAKVKLSTTGGEITGNITRDYATLLEKAINSNSGEMANYSGSGMKPEFLASLHNATLANELIKLQIDYWSSGMTKDSANTSKLAALINLEPAIYDKFGPGWNSGLYKEVRVYDTQNSPNYGGVIVGIKNDGTQEALPIKQKTVNAFNEMQS